MDQILEQIQALATAVTEQQRSQQELTISLAALSAQMNEMQQFQQSNGNNQQQQVGHAAQQTLHVGQPTFAASKIKLDLPPKFDGKPSQM